MMSIFRPRALGWSLLFALLVSLPFFSGAGSRPGIFSLEVTITSTESGVAQLFYDIGNGILEADSTTHSVRASPQPTKIRFALPPAKYRVFRFDPLNRECSMTVTGAQIVDDHGSVIYRFSPGQFKGDPEIARSTIRGETLEFQTIPDASDPKFALQLLAPLTLSVSPWDVIRESIVPFGVAFLSMLILAALPLERWAAGRLGRLAPWASANPGKTVGLFALLVVTIQCHPVIFLGRSFVSPNNAVLLLYDEFPVLPGYQNTELENAQASDVGALMWEHLYYPVIAHDALFRDHELPLWNRFSMNGVPMLGQGQSMFGDPLNWLSILTRSAAWSWDFRFVFSHWLLSCGVGLIVLTLTRRLPAALLTAVAGGFLGFFVFRLNHPANFSLEYSPWILLAWAKISRSPDWRAVTRWSLALILANWSVMTSGTMKEAYMLIACLNLGGFFLLLSAQSPWRFRLQSLFITVAAGAVLALISAPILSAFLETLTRSWTTYDVPTASQVNIAVAIGFFDDLFSRQLRAEELTTLPSVNFLCLCGVLWALASLRTFFTNRAFLAIAAGALVPFSFVYGFFPGSWIRAMPFVANIAHVDNTFSCPLIIFALVLGGFGFDVFLRQLAHPGWSNRFVVYLLLLGWLAGSYFSVTQLVRRSGFFNGYSAALLLGAVALPLFLRLANRRGDTRLFAAALFGAVLLFTWRHSQYVHSPFDRYVLNPQVRADFHAPSPVVAYVDQLSKEPSRPVGFGLNLFPSYNTILGWESMLGIEPLRNKYTDQLAEAFGIPRLRSADIPIVDEAHTPLVQAGLDLFNVRYYLASHSSRPREIPGLSRLGQFDLDLYESPTAWPRAFFTDRAMIYDKLEDFTAQARNGDRRPFVGLQVGSRDLPGALAGMPHDLAGRLIRPAAGYRLTTNKTSFDVEAPSAGFILLAESFYRDQFRATVNGKPQPYFRANHAWKAVYVDAPGKYHVEFEYWPPTMSLALGLSALGIAAFLGAAWIAYRRVGLAVAPAQKVA